MTDAAPQPLPHVKAAVPAGSAAAFEAWRWAVSPMFDFDTPDPAQRLSFSGGFSSTHFGAMRLGASTSSGAVTRRDRATIARSGTDDVVLQIYKSSDYLLRANGEDIPVKAGDVAFIDLTRPMAMHSPRVSNVALVVSRECWRRF